MPEPKHPDGTTMSEATQAALGWPGDSSPTPARNAEAKRRPATRGSTAFERGGGTQIHPDDCLTIIWHPGRETEPGECPRCGAPSDCAARYRGDDWRKHRA